MRASHAELVVASTRLRLPGMYRAFQSGLSFTAHDGLSLYVQLALECVGAVDRQLQIRKNCEQDARGVVGGLMSGSENVVCRVVCVQAYVPKTACKDIQYPPLTSSKHCQYLCAMRPLHSGPVHGRA